MSTCWNCGGQIEFRYVDGVITPIHVNGGWCDGGYGGGQVSYEDTPIKYNDLCYKTVCPKCGDGVYFIGHNGGSVWVDSLGWPWPKHACMDKEKEPSWHQYFIRKQPKTYKGPIYTGVIIDAVRLPISDSKSEILLAIDAGAQGRIILSTEGNTTTKYLKGAIVIVFLDESIIITSTQDVKPIYDSRPGAELMGLPKYWATISPKKSSERTP